MDDLISRQAAIKYFMTNTNWHDEDGYPIEDAEEKRKLLEDYFNGIPSAEPSCSEIPNSSDAINRQDAIDALDKRFDNIPMEQTAEILKLRKDLRELPTIQTEAQWIPVEKELPEPRIDVWVNSDLGQMVGYYDETVNLWYGRDYLELIVNAWMPLPEAYKPNNK